MSEREYCSHSGLSRGAVRNAKRGGRLVFHADGSINAAASDIRWTDIADLDQRSSALGSDAAMTVSDGGDGESYLKARTAPTVFQAKERQLVIQKTKGALAVGIRPDDDTAIIIALSTSDFVQQADGFVAGGKAIGFPCGGDRALFDLVALGGIKWHVHPP